jgi:hypothetical protein
MTASTGQIPPTETIFDGVLYRSRLEARWAVFFRAAGLRYTYEPEPFFLGRRLGWYLPDFCIHEPFAVLVALGMRPAAEFKSGFAAYVEVKPTQPLPMEIAKARALASELGTVVVIVRDRPILKNRIRWFWGANAGEIPLPDEYSDDAERSERARFDDPTNHPEIGLRWHPDNDTPDEFMTHWLDKEIERHEARGDQATANELRRRREIAKHVEGNRKA